MPALGVARGGERDRKISREIRRLLQLGNRIDGYDNEGGRPLKGFFTECGISELTSESKLFSHT